MVVFQDAFNHNSSWQFASVLLGSETNFKVVFEASRGESDTSNIALDDVTFTEGCAGSGTPTPPPFCHEGEFQCPSDNEICIPGGFVCDCIADCPQGEDESAEQGCGKFGLRFGQDSLNLNH